MVPQEQLSANTAAMRQDIAFITRRWGELDYPAMLEIRALAENKTPHSQKFALDWIEGEGGAIDWAAKMNAMGCNIYAVRNPVPSATKGAATDADIRTAFFLWADCDDERAAANVLNFVGPKWTAAVITGSIPQKRVHTYWELEQPCTDMTAWRQLQSDIAARFGSDGAVINPSRIMRLGGTITHPPAQKRAKGYVPELVTIRTAYDDDRAPVPFDRMRAVFVGSVRPITTAETQLGNFHIDTGSVGKTAADYAEILRRARTDGEKHGGVRDLTARLAGSGVSRAMAEAIVREACPVWDAGVEKLLETAYTKFTPHAVQQAVAATSATWPTPYTFFDAAALAPRQWVYGKHYLRRFVSVLASAGGIGKTSMQIVEALAIATGRPLLGEEVKERCNVWIINLEDPMDEMQRRILAAMQHYAIEPAEIAGRLFVDAGREFSITFAVQTREGVIPNTPLVEHLAQRIPALNIGAVFIDPFVGAHQINENDNMAVNTVIAQIRKVADDTNCAIGLVHHIRKGNGEDATIDSVRGAGALIGAARAARVINRVSQEDAEKLGIAVKDAIGIFRVDDGKANLAPPASASVFRRMEGVQIANGEWVGVATAFALPDEWGGMNDAAVNDMLRIMDMGIPDADGNEEYYSARPQDKERWAGNIITTYAFDNTADMKNSGQAKRILEQWAKNGLTEEFTYHSAKQRKDRKGVRATGRVGGLS